MERTPPSVVVRRSVIAPSRAPRPAASVGRTSHATLARAYDAALTGARSATGPRSVIVDSWRRSLAAHVDPDNAAPLSVYRHGELHHRRSEHPLAPVLGVLRATLGPVADQAGHVLVVTDADGDVLWRDGQSDVLRGADRVGLVEGCRWSESAMGTNAMGTALALDRPVQIFSAEHLARSLHQWSCAAAPIHDPDTGTLLGTVDVSGPRQGMHPATVALTGAAAGLAEAELLRGTRVEDDRLLAAGVRYLASEGRAAALVNAAGRVLAAHPPGWVGGRVALPDRGDCVVLPGGRVADLRPVGRGWLLRLREQSTARTRTGVEVRLLGHPTVHNRGGLRPLSTRRAEILALLALHPEGRTTEELAVALYGENGSAVTVRAEVHRLRAVLGGGLLGGRPYRLGPSVSVDLVAVREMLDRGDVLGAVRLHRTELLPDSDCPDLVTERHALTAALRRAVLGSGDTETLRTWAAGPGADDAEIRAALDRALPVGAPQRADLAVRAQRDEV